MSFFAPQMSAEQREAVRRERARISSRIIELTNRVPNAVLERADSDRAASWKAHAIKARRVATNDRASVDQLRSALGLMEQYER